MIAPKSPAMTAAVVCLLLLSLPGNMQAQPLDLSKTTIHCVTTDVNFLLRTPEILQQEVEKRTAMRWPVVVGARKASQIGGADRARGPHGTGGIGRADIFLVRLDDSARLTPVQRRALGALPAAGVEGYCIVSLAEDGLLIAGKDARGLLYGVGRLLRKLEMRPGSVFLPYPLAMTSTPVSKIRGHQLAYRSKTNAYDAFTVARFDQYIRDLALFGANSIEIAPPRTDDELTSEHMVLPPAKMIVEQSRICKSYGLDVWMWYPNVGKDYEHEDSIKLELLERDSVFASLPRLDNIFVPAGDPGDLDPEPLFRFLEREAVVLQKYHPHAKIWVSPQSFKAGSAWFDAFFKEVNSKFPWFGGVVFAPWVKIPVQQLRKLVDPSIPIRHYPDITHSLNCQYPVPHWDIAWAVTLGRECINPRPNDEKTIHNAIAPYCSGSISYSEGTNDDCNKFIWSDQDWDPTTPAIETLRDYARLFMGPDITEAAAQAILGLEENMRGPAITNASVDRTLQQWTRMEQQAYPALLSNARFQMCLIRAYFDAYTQRRLIHETEVEAQARELLQSGDADAVRRAIELLKTPSDILPGYKTKCMALADSLYKSIGAQLTIKRHGGRQERGNFMDFIDFPLGDAPWLLDQLSGLSRIGTDSLRSKRLYEILHRTDPGPGGIYDHPADPISFQRIKPGLPWAQDPGNLQSPHVGFASGLEGVHWLDNPMMPGFSGRIVPKAWLKQAMALYDVPLVAHYDGLDSNCDYTLRVVYTGRFPAHIRLTTGDGYLVHDYVTTGKTPLFEFNLPGTAIHKGGVDFVWQCKSGDRGTQVAELWLIRGTTHYR